MNVWFNAICKSLNLYIKLSFQDIGFQMLNYLFKQLASVVSYSQTNKILTCQVQNTKKICRTIRKGKRAAAIKPITTIKKVVLQRKSINTNTKTNKGTRKKKVKAGIWKDLVWWVARSKNKTLLGIIKRKNSQGRCKKDVCIKNKLQIQVFHRLPSENK